MAYFKFCRLLSLLVLFSVTNSQHTRKRNSEHEASKQLDKMLADYDPRIRPDFGGEAVVVNVTIFVVRFSNLDDKHLKFDSQFYFRQWWMDNRLANLDGINVTLDGDMGKKVWLPDSFIVNESEGKVHRFEKENSYTRINADGLVKRSSRISITSSCSMTFKYFPFDTQICALDFESYGYSTDDLIYVWGEGSELSLWVGEDGLNVQGFSYFGHRLLDKSVYLYPANYSRITAEFAWQRVASYHLWTFHVPIFLLSLVSIVPLSRAFKNSSVSSVSGNLFSAIAMILVVLEARREIPNDGVTYANGYMIFNIIFVFSTLIASLVSGYSRKEVFVQCNQPNGGQSTNLRRKLWGEFLAFFFLGILGLFNLIYWTTLSIQSNEGKLDESWVQLY